MPRIYLKWWARWRATTRFSPPPPASGMRPASARRFWTSRPGKDSRKSGRAPRPRTPKSGPPIPKGDLMVPNDRESAPIKRAVLAYSGGLDTSIIIPWLRENYGCEVVAMVGDVGQGDDYRALRKKALDSGASRVFVEDLREEFITGYLWKALQAGAVYEGKYLLGTSLARPVLAKRQVEVALACGADAVAHGCTGKGNDQVRFELAYKALAPHLKVIAPWREWSIKSREDALEFARAHKVPVPVSKRELYSRDQNIWHLSHEGGPLETKLGEPPEDAWKITKSPQQAPNRETVLTIGFEGGVPVSVDGGGSSPVRLLETLNAVAGKNGVG